MWAGPEWFIWIDTLGILSFAINAMIVAILVLAIAKQSLGHVTDFVARKSNPDRTVKLS